MKDLLFLCKKKTTCIQLCSFVLHAKRKDEDLFPNGGNAEKYSQHY